MTSESQAKVQVAVSPSCSNLDVLIDSNRHESCPPRHLRHPRDRRREHLMPHLPGPPPDHEWEFTLDETLSHAELAAFLRTLAEQITNGTFQLAGLDSIALPTDLQTQFRLERHGNRRRFIRLEV